MINEIIKLSQSNEWVGVSENVEIAKGKYKLKTRKDKVKFKIKRGIIRLWLRKLSLG
jgi:hypothetical protein